MGKISTALSLVGGGAKGIVTCGALKYMVEHKINYDAVFASSSGALNAVILCMGDIELLEHLWLNISNKDVRLFRPWKLLTSDASLYDSTPLYKTLMRYVDIDKVRAQPKPHIITLTDYKLVEPFHVMINKEIDVSRLCKYLLASCSIPLLFPPVMGRYYDGGVMDDYNIGHALDLYYQRNIVIHPAFPGPITVKGYQEAIDVLKTCMGWSNYLHMRSRFARDSANLIEVIPQHLIDLPILDFDYKGHDRHELISYGYQMAQYVFEEDPHARIKETSTSDQAGPPVS